jgi:hypothetical protein
VDIMKRTSVTTSVVALTLAACSGAAVSDTTADTVAGVTPETFAPTTVTTAGTFADTTIGVDEDLSAVVAGLQDRLTDFGAQIEASGAEAELTAAWNQTQAELAGLLATLQAQGTLDMATVESALDEFEQAVPTSETELRSAWEQVRTAVEDAFETVEAAG